MSTRRHEAPRPEDPFTAAVSLALATLLAPIAVLAITGAPRRPQVPHRTPAGFGGTYLSILGGSTGPWPRSYEEAALRFPPRLDPLAQALTLTFRGL